MTEYEFTLKFRLVDANADAEQYLDALAEAGCTDALVGIGKQGRIALTFDREAASAKDAMVSAIADVHSAIPGVRLIEASPDLVGISDIADLFDFTRQNMLKLVQRAREEFPSPVHEGKPSIWHLTDVLGWFQSKNTREISAELLETASMAMQINLYRDCLRYANQLSAPFQFEVKTVDTKLKSALEPVMRVA